MKVRCKLCQKVTSGGINRFKLRLVGGNKDVKMCAKTTTAIIREVQKALDQGKRSSSDLELDSFANASSSFANADGVGGGEEGECGEQSEDHSREEQSRSSLPHSKPSLLPRPKKKAKGRSVDLLARKTPEVVAEKKRKGPSQATLEKCYRTDDDRKVVLNHMADWWYECGIAFNTLNKRSFEVMVESIGQYGPGLKPPYYEMRVPLLEEANQKVDVLKERYMKEWAAHGCTLMSDGWTDTKGRHLINFLVNCTKGTFFLGSVDASGCIQDKRLLCDLLDSKIQEIGPDNVVQIVANNASNYKAAGEMLMHKYPKLFWAPCAAHCIDLMLEDIGKLENYAEVIVQGKKVATFLYRHGRLTDAMRKKIGGDLVKYAVIRFATSFLTLQSLYKNKNGLTDLFSSEFWRASKLSTTETGKQVYSTIFDQGFWKGVENSLRTCRPLLISLIKLTVNSGGVVFFALFGSPNNDDMATKEAAAVIKFSSSSRMATQSERLGYEFAKHLGIHTPQARVIHNSNSEWQRIKEAAEKARELAASNGDEVGALTCSDLLEALELSRCLFLMNYVHGSPLLETSKAFNTQEAAGMTAASLGRVLLLDLILRNEDRLPCRELGWQGNPANLMISDLSISSTSFTHHRIPKVSNNPFVNSVLQKEQRSNSADGRLDFHQPQFRMEDVREGCFDHFSVVAIDSGVPRRPPAGKRAKDHERYPKLVELILNSSDFSANILYEISGGKLGFAEDGMADLSVDADVAAGVHEFRGGFRAALRDLQSFHLFLLTLYQKLEGFLRSFSSIIGKTSGENETSDLGVHETGFSMDSESIKSTPKSSSSGSRGTHDSTSPVGRCLKASGEKDMFRGIRLTMKLRDFHKTPKVDDEVAKEIENWNERLKSEVIKFCEDNNFNTGFFDGLDSNLAVDAYELKVRLEHILERISLVSEAASTERPSPVTNNLFIGGALAAKSIYTLQHLGITHILCLCSNEIGQSDSQFPDLFEYKKFSINDEKDADISSLFAEASDCIDHVENCGGKILVHCFEGKSRSATVVLAHLILRKGYTLSKAWAMLKKVHRRAQPNDGFARALLTLDKRVHGKVSMDWQQKRPEMKVCPMCGKSVGLSTSSLKLHLQKSHKRLSSGSVDSAMKVEIQKAMDNLRISRAGSISPTGQASFFGT